MNVSKVNKLNRLWPIGTVVRYTNPLTGQKLLGRLASDWFRTHRRGQIVVAVTGCDLPVPKGLVQPLDLLELAALVHPDVVTTTPGKMPVREFEKFTGVNH